MATIKFKAFYSEIPLEQHESTVEINRIANHINASKKVLVDYNTTRGFPETQLEINHNIFTSGSLKKLTKNILQLFSSVSNILQFSKNEKKVICYFHKAWIVKPLMLSLREYYEINDKGSEYYLSRIEDEDDAYMLCKVNDKFNYFKELIGPNFSKLSKCYQKLNENMLQPVNKKQLELLRLIAPVREIDKDTSFMSQVAPLTGFIDGNDGKDTDSKLIIVRNELLDKSWINKSEGNYEVTEKYKKIQLYSVLDEV